MNWQRRELDEIKKRGYAINDPWDAVDYFERIIADFTGSKYAVSVDSCSSALFLSMKYCNVTSIDIPKNTYISVPMMAKMHNPNCDIKFSDRQWTDMYSLNAKTTKNLDIIDSAVSLKKDMYVKDSLQCISFQHRKPLKIGKGGMILTDNEDAYKWLRKASYDGRDRTVMFKDDSIDMLGYHMYMTPEDGARGVLLFEDYKQNDNSIGSDDYPDISKFKAFENL